MEDEWTRDPDGSYVNATKWRIKLIGRDCWQITRPNGFRADAYVYPTLAAAQARVTTVYAVQNVA
jgi:hypothetical protein